MPTEVIMPKMGLNMKEGVLAEWLVEDGQTVHKGQPIYIVETDKITNEIEAEFARRGTAAAEGGPERPINLDPGCVGPAKLILASMKDFAHRIYLGRGVYAEITLMYRKGRWEALPWTFPDFASGRYDEFLTEVRRRLRSEAGKGKRT